MSQVRLNPALSKRNLALTFILFFEKPSQVAIYRLESGWRFHFPTQLSWLRMLSLWNKSQEAQIIDSDENPLSTQVETDELPF